MMPLKASRPIFEGLKAQLLPCAQRLSEVLSGAVEQAGAVFLVSEKT